MRNKYVSHFLVLVVGVFFGAYGTMYIQTNEARRADFLRLTTELIYFTQLLQSQKNDGTDSASQLLLNLADGHILDLMALDHLVEKLDYQSSTLLELALCEYTPLRKNFQGNLEQLPSYIAQEDRSEYLQNEHKIRVYLEDYVATHTCPKFKK